jgi:hypothetical protein
MGAFCARCDPAADLYGCDPWDRSIDLGKQDGLTVNLALSEYLPTHLPFTERFHLIYAFSVFTHLSLRATRQCLDTLHGYIGENGVLVITIRPVEYWAADPNASQAEREHLSWNTIRTASHFVLTTERLLTAIAHTGIPR